MIGDLLDSITDDCPSPEQTLCILNNLDQPTLSNAFPQLMESYSKKQKLIRVDFENIKVAVQLAIERSVLTTEKEVAVMFEADMRVIVWIAIVLAVRNVQNCVIPAERIRQTFARRVKKSGRLWGYQPLDRYYGLLVSKDKQFEEPYRKDTYERLLFVIQVVQDFMAGNLNFLPPGFDFRDVLLRYVCMNRCESEAEKNLLQSTIDKITQLSMTGLTAMRFCFEFFRYGADDKTAPFLPQQSLIQVVRRYSLEQLNRQIDTTFIGMTWTEQNYRHSIKNLIRTGLTASTVAIIIKIKDSALRSNRIEPLIQMTEADVLTGFIYLKHANLFKASLDLLKEFVIGAPPRAKIFEKVLVKVKAVSAAIQPHQNRAAFLELLEALKVKYQSTCPTHELKDLIAQLAGSLPGYTCKERKVLDELLDRYDWLNFESKQAEKLADSKPGHSHFRGLCNIGNSCYMNSFFQALYMTKEFRLKMLELDTNNREKELLGKLTTTDFNEKRKELRVIKERMVPLVELQKLFALLYRSKRPYINPSFIKNILPPQFRNLFQHDAGEFGRIFLEGLEGSIEHGFEGESDILIECQDCGSVRSRTEKFWDFMLPPCGNDIENVKAMIEKHNEPEELEKLECEHCRRPVDKSVKRARVKKLPPYLIFTLNRFTYSVEFKKKLKLGYKVDIPESIELVEYVEGADRICTYDLYAVIVHRGTTAESGHYYTFARVEPTQNPTWICFDDSSTTQLDSLQRLFELIAGAANDTPYILFYQNREHIERLSKEKLFSSPFILSQRLASIIEKQDIEYLKESQRPKFTLPKIPFSAFFRKDDDDDDLNRPGGNNNHLIM